MGEEKSLFIEDLIEKKVAARGSYNKRSHAGGSGRKKWSCEYLTKKELEKMNGETKTYRLKDPMKWAEFKEMPDDIKVMYIKGIRERFGCTDAALSQMFGVHQSTLLTVLKGIGVPHGEGGRYKRWDKAGFEAWYRTDAPEEAETVEEAEKEEIPVQTVPDSPDSVVEEVMREFAEQLYPTKKKAIPSMGTMTFSGKTEDILEAIASVLGGAEVMLTISWDVMDGDEE